MKKKPDKNKEVGAKKEAKPFYLPKNKLLQNKYKDLLQELYHYKQENPF